MRRAMCKKSQIERVILSLEVKFRVVVASHSVRRRRRRTPYVLVKVCRCIEEDIEGGQEWKVSMNQPVYYSIVLRFINNAEEFNLQEITTKLYLHPTAATF